MKRSTNIRWTNPWQLLIAVGTLRVLSSLVGPKQILAPLVILGSLLAGAPHAFGQNWTPTGATNSWGRIATSADGTKLIATSDDVGPIYASTNSGTNWSATSAPVGLWNALASSADGTRLLALGSDYLYVTNGYDIYTFATNSRIYFSTNAGVSWTKGSGTPTDVTVVNWYCATTSADGFKSVACSYGRIYTSTNAGMTWTLRSGPNKQWTSVASSADGTSLVVVASSGGIYTSTDSGASWVQTSAPSSFWWSSVASSADGLKLVAVVRNISVTSAGGPIYVSKDGGTNWVVTSAPTNKWASVAASVDGTTLVTVAANLSPSGMVGTTSISRDSGETWTTTDTPGAYWLFVASSADGNKLFTADGASYYGGGFFASQLPATPLLNIAAAGGGTAISWIIPSMDFVLQETADLTTANWADVTAQPAMRNYENQVTLPLPSGNRFFRLKLR